MSVAAVAMLLLSACGDDNDWAAGPQDSDHGIGAYFPAQEKYKYEFEVTPEECNFEVTVGRLSSDAEQTVAILYTSEVEGWKVPETVTFAAGEATATFTVNCGDIPKAGYKGITLSVPADQYYAYASGTESVKIQAMLSDWTIISDYVAYYYWDGSGNRMFPDTYGTMKYQYDSENDQHLFRLTDYYGTGFDVDFTWNSAAKSKFTPQNSSYLAWYDSGNYDIYDNDKDEDFLWYPTTHSDEADVTDSSAGNDLWFPGTYVEPDDQRIYGCYFYGSSSYSNIQIWNTTTLYGYANTTCAVYDKDNESTWGYWQFDFYLNFNPFETATEE